ncbi:MAG: toxin glutamine deamidase domain-containing protein [Dermatophilaceae bacterium]
MQPTGILNGSGTAADAGTDNDTVGDARTTSDSVGEGTTLKHIPAESPSTRGATKREQRRLIAQRDQARRREVPQRGATADTPREFVPEHASTERSTASAPSAPGSGSGHRDAVEVPRRLTPEQVAGPWQQERPAEGPTAASISQDALNRLVSTVRGTDGDPMPQVSPAQWVQFINPDGPRPEAGHGGLDREAGVARRLNRVDGVRSALDTWLGRPTVSGVQPMPAGSSPSDPWIWDDPKARAHLAGVYRWMSDTPAGAGMFQEVAENLRIAGPGSAATVGYVKPDVTGHIVLAVNDGGTVVWVDPQAGTASVSGPAADQAESVDYAMFSPAGMKLAIEAGRVQPGQPVSETGVARQEVRGPVNGGAIRPADGRPVVDRHVIDRLAVGSDPGAFSGGSSISRNSGSRPDGVTVGREAAAPTTPRSVGHGGGAGISRGLPDVGPVRHGAARDHQDIADGRDAAGRGATGGARTPTPQPVRSWTDIAELADGWARVGGVLVRPESGLVLDPVTGAIETDAGRASSGETADVAPVAPAQLRDILDARVARQDATVDDVPASVGGSWSGNYYVEERTLTEAQRATLARLGRVPVATAAGSDSYFHAVLGTAFAGAVRSPLTAEVRHDDVDGWRERFATSYERNRADIESAYPALADSDAARRIRDGSAEQDVTDLYPFLTDDVPGVRAVVVAADGNTYDVGDPDLPPQYVVHLRDAYAATIRLREIDDEERPWADVLAAVAEFERKHAIRLREIDDEERPWEDVLAAVADIENTNGRDDEGRPQR